MILIDVIIELEYEARKKDDGLYKVIAVDNKNLQIGSALFHYQKFNLNQTHYEIGLTKKISNLPYDGYFLEVDGKTIRDDSSAEKVMDSLYSDLKSIYDYILEKAHEIDCHHYDDVVYSTTMRVKRFLVN